ncbi:glutamate--tRNA ligase [bacterium]|nr:glutamate--tRNA ligase [FCB group bacterium]MBL7190667.1 glutamate--tRNA ligase [bacterium]
MSDKTIRVRFAPSPTGYLHLGGLRTALFNYLYARSQGGKIILRVEDTDQSRYIEGALENLLEVFRWLDIEFDEGPDIGGEYGPYIQSKRLDIYRTHLKRLISEGHAYRCFCPPERLQSVREEQQRAGKTPMYDRLCRSLDPQESLKRPLNEPFVVRLKIPLQGRIDFSDGIRGDLSFDVSEIDDQVLLKSDSYPTYHLANVIDDHLMGITDVIRGEEWLTSTPKHVHLYRCFGWEAPKFYHLPLLLNPDRTKLSKRQGDAAVKDYRAKGYLPEALINYTALLGWHPSDDREVFTKIELEKEFSIGRVSKAGAVFDVDKLNWINRQHLNKLSDEQFLEKAAEHLPSEIDFTSEKGMKLLQAVRERINNFKDIAVELKPFTGDRKLPDSGEAWEILQEQNVKELLHYLIEDIDESPEWNADIFKELVKKAGKKAGVKGKSLWIPVRIALTGDMHGPELGLIAEILGKEKLLILVQETLEIL